MRRTRLTLLLAIVLLSEACPCFGGDASNEGKQLGDLRGVIAADFNHDGSRVITRLRNSEIGFWDVADGTPIVGDLGSGQLAESYVMSADRKAVLIGFKRNARVFDASTGAALSPLLDVRLLHDLPTRAVFAPDDATVLIFETNEASIWKVSRGERVAKISLAQGPHEEAPPSAIFTEAGAAFYLMDPDGSVTRYETKNWQARGKAMKHPRLDTAYEFGFSASLDGKWIATWDSAGENGPKSELQLWDAMKSKPLGAPLIATNGFAAKFIPKVDRVLITPARGEGQVRELPSMKPVYPVRAHDELDGPTVEISPRGGWILSWGSDRWLDLIDAKTGKLTDNFSSKAAISKVLTADDSSLYVVFDNTAFLPEKYHDNYIMKMQLPELRTVGSIRVLEYLNGVSLSPEGRYLLVQQGWTDEERIVIFDTATMKPLEWSRSER